MAISWTKMNVDAKSIPKIKQENMPILKRIFFILRNFQRQC